jgi:Lar family restriction alleviation protein
MDELKPCPFCGGDNLQLSSHSGYRARMSPTGEIFSIRCRGCEVTFPSEYKKDLLIGKWNNRSPQDEGVSAQDKQIIIANHLNVLSKCIIAVPVPERDREANIKMRDAILNVMASSVEVVR